jgi:serine/threonine protein kinase
MELAPTINVDARNGRQTNLIVQVPQNIAIGQVPHNVAICQRADRWMGMSTRKVAVKVLSGVPSGNPDFLPKLKERLERESQDWQHLQHPNVSEFLGLVSNFVDVPALILPFYGNGTVVDYVKDKDNETKLDMVGQIAQGLSYLHGQSVVHGDLRGSNVLIDGDGCPRICDYGLALIIKPSEFPSINTAGAYRWTAPEIMDPPDATFANDSLALFTTKSDIYAFAMTVIEIFTGKIPFDQKKNESSVIFAVPTGSRPDLPAFLNEQKGLGELVQECWNKEPGSRPTTREVARRLSKSMREPNAPLGVGNLFQWWFGSWF